MGPMTTAGERIGARDVVYAAMISALGLALMILNVADHDENMRNPDQQAAIHVGNLLPYPAIIPLFLLVTVPLLWRRAALERALAASCAGLLLNFALTGTEVLRCGAVLLVAFSFAFRAGTQSSRLGLALSVGLAFVDLITELDPASAIVLTGVTIAMWGIGRIVGARTRLAGELRATSAQLRAARDDRARMEVAGERTRVSAELDELLQRRLGALAALADDAPADDHREARATFAEIERESRSTLEEMRAAVKGLRGAGGEATLAPQPTITQLEALLLQAKGTDARLTVEGDPRVLPPAVELAAYRIVEQLLAALEDAPDVEVCVNFADDALELSVSGPARRRARAALDRARERARLQDGSFEATVRAGRAEAMVSLPVLAVV
jgi:signal transduction histidine kinase